MGKRHNDDIVTLSESMYHSGFGGSVLELKTIGMNTHYHQSPPYKFLMVLSSKNKEQTDKVLAVQYALVSTNNGTKLYPLPVSGICQCSSQS